MPAVFTASTHRPGADGDSRGERVGWQVDPAETVLPLNEVKMECRRKGRSARR